MTTLLSLPDEVLIAIFRLVFADDQPVRSYGRTVSLGDLRINKRLREVAGQALPASVQVGVSAGGIVKGPLTQWLAKDRWQHVRHLVIMVTLVGPDAQPPNIAGLANPMQVELILRLPATMGDPASWSPFMFFPSTAVTSMELAGCEELRYDLPALLQTFPRLGSLVIGNVRTTDVAPQGPLYPLLRHFSELYAPAQNPHPRNNPHRLPLCCPNLFSAAVRASQAVLLGLPATLQELAMSLHLTDPTEHLSHCMGLGRFSSLQKLAFQQVILTGPEQCATALAAIPSSIRHLAFHETGAVGFGPALGLCVQDAAWLPGLKTMFVSTNGRQTRQVAVDDEGLKQACLVRNIRLYTTHVSRTIAQEDAPVWPTKIWL
jgi:hypothetical protein